MAPVNKPLIILLFFLTTYLLSGQETAHIAFQEKPIAPGLLWKQIHSEKYFDGPQNINILQISDGYSFDLAYAEDTLIKTSDFAKEAGAVAAVNGGFFDMKNGGSVTYLKAGGQTINQTTQRFIDAKNEILESALIITSKGELLIRPTLKMESWKNKSKYSDILVTGPLLLYNSRAMPLVDRSFTNTRHPRTCACTTTDNKTLLITVDGRHEQASGMSLQELTALTQLLQCKDAINLDGGGSTTMYIQGQSESGVVNHPSDNRIFDNNGERPGANAILVIKK